MVLSLLFRHEALLICVIMAAPPLLLASLAGAWIAHMVLPRHGTPPRLYVTLAAFLPYIASVPEGRMCWPTETREVRDTIEIDASAEAI